MGKKSDEPVFGVVSNCDHLNVREFPSIDSEVICEILSNETVQVVEYESTDDFYKVYTQVGLEGFCKKEYIKL